MFPDARRTACKSQTACARRWAWTRNTYTRSLSNCRKQKKCLIRLKKEKVKELGRVISGKESGRTSEDQITVADLTGVAVQDIKIAAAVYDSHRTRREQMK